MTEGELLIPGRFTPWFFRWFSRFVPRMMRKSFFAVRVVGTTSAMLRDAASIQGPLVVVANHQSWWDPLVMILVHGRDCGGRELMAPMEAAQLRRFGFFRRLGIFGIEPDDPASLDAMGRYVRERFAGAADGAVLWITPQGEFADVRTRIRVRPGVSRIAAETKDVRVLSAAIEYGFWVDKKPEAFLRLAEVGRPDDPGSTTAWHRAITRAMRENSSALADLVMARDPGPFETISGGSRAGTTFFYDIWQRLRRTGGSIQPTRRSEIHSRSGREDAV